MQGIWQWRVISRSPGGKRCQNFLRQYVKSFFCCCMNALLISMYVNRYIAVSTKSPLASFRMVCQHLTAPHHRLLVWPLKSRFRQCR